LSGIVFDLPGVIDGARRAVGETGPLQRCQAVHCR
jgi:hypothetical protein